MTTARPSTRADQSPTDVLIETLKAAPNEGTAEPYWLIIDPRMVVSLFKGVDEDGKEWAADVDDAHLEMLADQVPSCITGPFFSRTDAEAHLKARGYAFGKDAYVYCFSGYWSNKYKAFCRSLQ